MPNSKGRHWRDMLLQDPFEAQGLGKILEVSLRLMALGGILLVLHQVEVQGGILLVFRGLRRDSPKLSLGGGSSKRLHSREAEGSSHRSGSKHRRHASPVPFDHEEEEAEDEEMAPIFSPIARVQTEIMDLEMRDISEARVPPSSPMLMSHSPTFDGIPPISIDLVRASSQLVVQELELPGTPFVDHSVVPDSDVVNIPPVGQPGGVGASKPVLAGEPSTLTVSVASESELPLVPSSKGKELTMSPRDEPTSESFEESESLIPRPPLVKPIWLSRPDAQPLFVEEMMTKAFIYATAPKD
ncbi:hypothetical protein CJ030_MR1G017645 [Morella rubra]|uniref:Uncharacterized protein n=1 Tax=Morella rubra TaxID=262757 RepID=A0A6A1WIZ1_9ROSI|nr:hypothetical protein CJ030_MR6G016529 [Morella rubra]KAB1225265.1 hypothetical protein CJ030_MR1G017645 [Morella rubra]